MLSVLPGGPGDEKVAGPAVANKSETRNAAQACSRNRRRASPLERQAERTSHPKQSDPGIEYAGSSSSCPSSLNVFLPLLNKSQVSPHEEVYHSSHPEANDMSLKVCAFIQLLVTRFYNGLHLVRRGVKFLEGQQLPKCKAKSLHHIIMFAPA